MPNGFSENHEVAVCLLQPFSRWLLGVGGTWYSHVSAQFPLFPSKNSPIGDSSSHWIPTTQVFGPRLQYLESVLSKLEKHNCFTALKNVTQTLQLPGKKKNIHPFLWNNIPHVFGHDRLKPVFLPIQKQEVDFSKFSGKCKDIWAKPLAGWHYQ